MKKQTKEKLPDPLQMPLRLDPTEVVALNELQKYFQINTRNRTVTTVITTYKKLNEERNILRSQVLEQTKKINQLKEYFNTMKDAESEIFKLLNSK